MIFLVQLDLKGLFFKNSEEKRRAITDGIFTSATFPLSLVYVIGTICIYIEESVEHPMDGGASYNEGKSQTFSSMSATRNGVMLDTTVY